MVGFEIFLKLFFVGYDILKFENLTNIIFMKLIEY
jgi:hypothetical protein